MAQRVRLGLSRMALPAMAFCALVASAGCSGGSGGSDGDGAIPGIESATAERDAEQGAAKLTSTVTVRFDRDFRLARTDVPLASLFELSTPTLEGKKERVLVRSATPSKDDARVVTLAVDRLIADGAELTVQQRAFQRGKQGVVTAKVESELEEVLVALASVGFVPTNPSFEGRPRTAELKPADRDPAATRSALEASMKARGAPGEVVARALQRYDTMPATVVGPKARAALAALTGTFAEPAIASLLTDGNCTGKPLARLAFEKPPGELDLQARVTYAPDGARIISIAPELEGERLEYLLPILVHEPIHCDQEDGRVEEVAATAFDTYFYLVLVATLPELANGNTILARDLNLHALAMFNSGRARPELVGVLPSVGVKQALAGSSSRARSFADFVASQYPSITRNDSPPERLAQAYVAGLASALGVQPGAAFDLGYLDQLIGAALPLEAYPRLIAAFGLEPE